MNIYAVGRVAAGRYVLWFTAPFASTNYAVIGSPKLNLVGNVQFNFGLDPYGVKATNYAQVATFGGSTYSAFDVDDISVSVLSN